MSETTKLAIFVTGSGTNCENIIRYFSDKPEVEIPIVVSSRSDAYALVRAEQLGVPTAVITRQQFADEPRLVIHTVRGCDYIILAGFLPKIPTYLIDQFPNRIINIHPALLPKFGGKGMWGHHVHEAVKARLSANPVHLFVQMVKERLVVIVGPCTKVIFADTSFIAVAKVYRS